MLRKTTAVETEAMVDAMAGLKFGSVFGPVEFRAIDHQSTMGAFVGHTVLKNGRGAMADWRYADGKRLPAGRRRGARAASAKLNVRRLGEPGPPGPQRPGERLLAVPGGEPG